MHLFTNPASTVRFPLHGMIPSSFTIECMLEAPARYVPGVQVTAYSVITANGETGIMPTGVNFQIGGGSPQSGPAPSEGPPSPSSSSQVRSPDFEAHDMNSLIPPSA